MSLPIVAILGARGQQGGSVLDHLLKYHSNSYTLRAIVRDPSKVSLSGDVQVIAGDFTSVDSLKNAFNGATFVFAMTIGDTEAEIISGKAIADAVKATPSVKTLIFSSAPDAAKISGYTLKCTNFVGKAEVQRYMQELGIPVVFVWPGMFMQNFITYQIPPVVEEVTTFVSPTRPDVAIPFIDIRDYGKLVHHIFQDPEVYIKKTIKFVGDWMTYPQLVSRFSAATSKKATYKRVSYEGFVEPIFGNSTSFMAEAIMDMYKYIDRFGYYGDEEGDSIVSCNTWEQFVLEKMLGNNNSPAEMGTTPATKALASYINCFEPSNTGPVSQLFDLFTESSIVEFPYAPDGTPSILDGIERIKSHYSSWPQIFKFHALFDIQIFPVSRNVAVGSMSSKATIITTSKDYNQKYFWMLTVGSDGKIAKLKEYWDTKWLSAFSGSENMIKP